MNATNVQDHIYRKLSILNSRSCRAVFLCGLKTKLEKRPTTLMEVAKWEIEQISPNKRDESITIISGPISWDLVATFDQMSH